MPKPVVITKNLNKYFPAKVGYAFLVMVALTVLVLAWATRAFNRAIS